MILQLFNPWNVISILLKDFFLLLRMVGESFNKTDHKE